MKKFLALFVAFALFMGIACAKDIEGIYNNNQVVYYPTSDTWSNGGMTEDRVVLTKKTGVGSGSYSEYYYSNGKQAFTLKGNFEFIDNGNLISVDNNGLKYSKVSFKNNEVKETPLSDKELKEIFDADVIKVSSFENGEIKVHKPFLHKKTILLVNDTDKYFHKYAPIPAKVNKTDVKGLMTLYKYGNVKFKHFDDNSVQLLIKVR